MIQPQRSLWQVSHDRIEEHSDSAWQSGEVEANGIRLHYTRTGGAKPPVVLAHGFSDDGLCWTPVAEALAPRYDVIMVDARGHGRSSAPEQGYSATIQAADLQGVITALGLQRPARMRAPPTGRRCWDISPVQCC